jgi:hypothetical protein
MMTRQQKIHLPWLTYIRITFLVNTGTDMINHMLYISHFVYAIVRYPLVGTRVRTNKKSGSLAVGLSNPCSVSDSHKYFLAGANQVYAIYCKIHSNYRKMRYITCAGAENYAPHRRYGNGF